jgi:hypothetical protein
MPGREMWLRSSDLRLFLRPFGLLCTLRLRVQTGCKTTTSSFWSAVADEAWSLRPALLCGESLFRCCFNGFAFVLTRFKGSDSRCDHRKTKRDPSSGTNRPSLDDEQVRRQSQIMVAGTGRCGDSPDEREGQWRRLRGKTKRDPSTRHR